MKRLTLTLALLACALLVPAAALAARPADRNHDGLPDRWERAHRLSLKVNQGPRDQDRDGLNNRQEYADHTDPRNADSDDDGVRDGFEDADRDGTPNAADVAPGAHDPAPGDGDHEGGPVILFDHVVGRDGARLTLGKTDGSEETASVTPKTQVACAKALPGPFGPCPDGAVAAGAKVAYARHEVTDGGLDAWKIVFLLVPPVAAPAPAPAPEPTPEPKPAPQPAPASVGSVVSFDGGVLKLHRPNGEEPAFPLAPNAEVGCIVVKNGAVVSKGACSAGEHLVPGAQLALTKLGVVEGVTSWTSIAIIVPGS